MAFPSKLTGRTYKTLAAKKQAETAWKAAKTSYGAKASAKQTSGPNKVNKTTGVGRESLVEVLSHPLSAVAQKTAYTSFVLRGDSAHAQLQALKARRPQINGVRLEVSFPLTGGNGRFSVASLRTLSTGSKSVQVVSKVIGAQTFDSIVFADKWITVKSIAGAIQPEDELGNTVLGDDDFKIVVFSAESSEDLPAQSVIVKCYVTMTVDKVSPAGGVSAL